MAESSENAKPSALNSLVDRLRQTGLEQRRFPLPQLRHHPRIKVETYHRLKLRCTSRDNATEVPETKDNDLHEYQTKNSHKRTRGTQRQSETLNPKAGEKRDCGLHYSASAAALVVE